jgi:2-polyprenyl-3-methyl-5-hydroxy-6-metoxy-1,4-benzoquinol methylase
MKSFKNFYNKFHKYSAVQYKLISENNFTYQTIIKIFNKYIKQNDTVLDIGCGVGVLSLYYGNKCKLVTGIDISNKVITLAIKSAKILYLDNSVKFKTLNFPDDYLKDTFDKIIFSEVLEHIFNESKALIAISKMLKHDGKLIITVPSTNSPLYKMGLSKKFDEEVGHLRRYSANDLIDKLEENGFKIHKIYKTSGLIRNIMYNSKQFDLLIRLMKGYIGIFINYLDSLTINVFGESQIIAIATKKR